MLAHKGYSVNYYLIDGFVVKKERGTGKVLELMGVVVKDTYYVKEIAHMDKTIARNLRLELKLSNPFTDSLLENYG